MDNENRPTPVELDETGELPTVTVQAPCRRGARGLRDRLELSGTTLFAGVSAAVVVAVCAAVLTVSLHKDTGIPDAPSVVSDPSTAAATDQAVPAGSRTWKNGRLVILRTSRAASATATVHAPAGAASATVAAPSTAAGSTPPASAPASASASAPVSTAPSTSPPASSQATATPPAPSPPAGGAT